MGAFWRWCDVCEKPYLWFSFNAATIAAGCPDCAARDARTPPQEQSCDESMNE